MTGYILLASITDGTKTVKKITILLTGKILKLTN